MVGVSKGSSVRGRAEPVVLALQAAIDIAAIADGHDPHDQLTVLDRIHDAIVPNPETPPRAVPLEGFDVERRRVVFVQRLLEFGEAIEDPESIGAGDLEHAALSMRGEARDVAHRDQAWWERSRAAIS